MDMVRQRSPQWIHPAAGPKGGKYVAPESLLPYLAQQIHSLGHSGPATMNHRFSNQWWNPKFRNAATETVQEMCYMSEK